MKHLIIFLLFSINLNAQFYSCSSPCNRGDNAIQTTQQKFCTFQQVYVDNLIFCNTSEEESFKWIIIKDSVRDTINVNKTDLTSQDYNFGKGIWRVCRMLFYDLEYASTSSEITFEIIDCNSTFTDTLTVINQIDSIVIHEATEYIQDTIGWQTTIVNCDETTNITPVEDLCEIVSLFPNPTDNCITLDIKSELKIEYSIYHLDQLVEEGIYENDIYCLKQYGTGVFYIKLKFFYEGKEYIITNKILVI